MTSKFRDELAKYRVEEGPKEIDLLHFHNDTMEIESKINEVIAAVNELRAK